MIQLSGASKSLHAGATKDSMVLTEVTKENSLYLLTDLVTVDENGSFWLKVKTDTGFTGFVQVDVPRKTK